MILHLKYFARLIGIVFLSVALNACQENGGTDTKTWSQEEILQQLSELRQEIKAIKDDLAIFKAQQNSPGAQSVSIGIKNLKLNTDITLGDPDAKLVIAEFTDYQCPYCARHNQSVLTKIKKQLIETSKAKYAMYDFPLGFHAQAKSVGIAARNV